MIIRLGNLIVLLKYSQFNERKMQLVLNDDKFSNKHKNLFTKLRQVKLKEEELAQPFKKIQEMKRIQQNEIVGIQSIESQQNSPREEYKFHKRIQEDLNQDQINELEGQVIQFRMRKAIQIANIYFQTGRSVKSQMILSKQSFNNQIDQLIKKVITKVTSIKSSFQFPKDLESTLGPNSKTPSLNGKYDVSLLGTIRQFQVQEDLERQSNTGSEFTLGNKKNQLSTFKKMEDVSSSAKSKIQSCFRSQKAQKNSKNASVSEFNAQPKQSSSKRIKQKIMKIKN